MSHVLIKSSDKDLWLFATDLEVFIRAKSHCVQSSGFSAVIPAGELYELIKELDSEKVEFEGQDGSVLIKCREGKYRLQVLSPTQFPIPPEKSFSKVISISSGDLQNLIEKTAFAASQDESRYVLTGVLVEIDKDVIRFVSSDGHRLAMFEREHEGAEERKFILPKNAVSDIKRILASQSRVFDILSAEDEVLLRSDEISMWIKLITEEYPNWRDVIPSDDEVRARIILKTNELKKSLKRANLFASSKFPFVILEPKAGKLVVEAETDELGAMHEEIDADVSGDEIKIALSIKYIQDALSTMETSLTSIKLFGESSPCIVEPVSGEGALNLIMPIKI